MQNSNSPTRSFSVAAHSWLQASFLHVHVAIIFSKYSMYLKCNYNYSVYLSSNTMEACTSHGTHISHELHMWSTEEVEGADYVDNIGPHMPDQNQFACMPHACIIYQIKVESDILAVHHIW